MKLLDSLNFRIATLFHRSKVRDEMEEELRSHIQHRADDLERSGMGRAEAERRARVEFGGREKYKEEIHQAIGSAFFETLIMDVRFSLRQLRKSPGFTAAAVLTLALAIGANAVVFGVMDALILRPLNLPQYETLYGTHYGDNPAWQSYPNYLDLRDRNRTFEELAAFNFALGIGLDTGKDAIVGNGFATTGNYFDVLRIHPYLGRFFHVSDERGDNSAPFPGRSQHRGPHHSTQQASLHRDWRGTARVPGNSDVHISRFLHAHCQSGRTGRREPEGSVQYRRGL
jgi:hypothetical protein